MKRSKLNAGHYLEALDRVHVFSSTFDNHICDHPVVRAYPDIKKQVDQIALALGQLYQDIGALDGLPED